MAQNLGLTRLLLARNISEYILGSRELIFFMNKCFKPITNDGPGYAKFRKSI